MARRIGTVAFAVLALSVSVVASRRAILSEAGGAQFELGDVSGMHRHLMSTLKSAQESAGIFVDDAHLFEQPLSGQGRKLQQTDAGVAATALANPTVLATLLTMISQGFNVGSFPGAALSLPGGSALGYAPTDDSYCLFGTQPYSGPAAAPKVVPGPLPAAGLPETFGCVAASADVPTGPDSFTIDVNGNAFVCQGVAPAPAGRKLLQAPTPQTDAIGSILASIGLPIWNCVVATTPAGNTTLGDSTLAVLNDLGVVAEHLLVYLNANGQLTYDENVVNDFVSLTNPLYPSGPRLNFSIDFSSFDKDHALFKEIFGKPAPVTPPSEAPSTPEGASPAAAPGTPEAVPAGPQASPSDTGSATDTPPTSDTTTTPAGPGEAPPAPTTTTLTAFDGYVDNCQIVIGSIPHADGNFDRNNNFTAVIANGSVQMPLDTTNSFAGQVAYIIPASKATEYPALTAETRSQAQFCNDIATLEPVYNPLATVINANATGISANPLTTTASFGQSYGMSVDQLLTALAVTVPEGQTLWSYDALADAATGSAAGLALLKANIQVANLVTSGANMLTNDSSLYASFAIIMNQALAKKVLYSPPLTGRKLLQAPAVDLTNATTLASIMQIAAQLVPTQSDQTTTAALIQGLTPDQLAAVGTAVANLNAAVAAAPDADTVEKGQYYAQTELASQVNELATGTISQDDFNSLTTTDAIGDALSKTTLPGSVTPPAAAAPPTPEAVPQTQSSTAQTQSSPSSSSGSGLSHGGKVALATVLPIVGVIAIVAVAAFLITRRNRGTYEETSNNSLAWWRRPFARSGANAGPSTV